MLFFFDYTALSLLCFLGEFLFCFLFSSFTLYTPSLSPFLAMLFKIFKSLKSPFFSLSAMCLLFSYLHLHLTNLLSFCSLLMTTKTCMNLYIDII